MNIEDALKIIDAALSPAILNDMQERVFRGAWEGKSYEEIAEQIDYESEYVKHVGYQLWQELSRHLNTKVTKRNLQSVLRQKSKDVYPPSDAISPDILVARAQRPTVQATQFDDSILSPSMDNAKNDSLVTRRNWGEAINITTFYGRIDEVKMLQEWVLEDRCQLVALLGMGGIGKTALARKFVDQIQDQFDCLIWRSLRQAPPLDEILTAILKFITPDSELRLPESDEGKLARLIESLQSTRCLLILDNMESIFWSGDSEKSTHQRAGHYRKGYEGYGELLKYIGESSHQSCLLLTSREKPKEIAALESQDFLVRSLIVQGLPSIDARHILQTKQINGTDENCNYLIQRYAGNPLALKIVISTIQELFDGDVGEFLQEGIAFFGDIGELLDEQFNRLSRLEKQVMFWLAVSQEPISPTELNENVVSAVSKRELLEALESLGRRPLIEKIGGRFSQQPVVMEYMTEKIIEQAFQELVTKEFSLLESHSLLKATAKDYIRDGQTRLILDPIIEKLKAHFKSLKLTEIQLKQVLSILQESSTSTLGYSTGNLINLLCQLKVNLKGYDFSHLMVRQAYLRNVDLHQVNFAHANLDAAVFTETFGGILSIVLSSDGTLLATGDTDGNVRLWSIADGKQLWIGEGHLSWVWSVSFSPDDRLIASSGLSSTVMLWDVRTGKCFKTLHSPFDVMSIAFSPTDNTLIAGGWLDPQAVLLDINTGECLQVFEGHDDMRIWTVEFSPDGRMIATGSTDTTVKIWDVEAGICLQTFSGHCGWVRSVVFHPNSQVVASASNDHTIKLWSVQTGECLQNLSGHVGCVSEIAFNVDGTILASSSYDYTLKIWKIASGQCLQTLQGHTNLIWTVAFSPDNQTVVTGGDDHSVKFWDIRTGRCTKTLQGHSNSIGAINFPPNLAVDRQSTYVAEIPAYDSKSTAVPLKSPWLLASGSEDTILRLWDVTDKSIVKALVGHEGRILSLVYGSDGQTLLSGSTDCTAKLWDIETGQCLETFLGHTSWIWAVDYSLDDKILATGSEDASIRLWSTEGQCLRIIQGKQGTVYAIAFSPDAKTLASGGLDGTIKLWNISNNSEHSTTLHEHTGSAMSVIFSPDGQSLISCSKDKTVKIWDFRMGTCVKTLEGHSAGVWAIAISPDGRLLASGGEDKTLRIWDFESGQCLKKLTGHQNMIKSITFHLEESVVISGSFDETMKVWDINTGECLKTLRVERPYEGMNITGTTGLTEAQKTTLKALGAIAINAT